MTHRLSALLGALLLAGCNGPAGPSVDAPWIRLPAVAGRPGAAYFALRGGAGPVTLTAFETAAAQRTELHESMASGSMMTMTPIARVPVPAHATVNFAPGGKHVMLFGIDPRLKPGQTAPVTLRFADGHSLEANARVVGAGDPAP